MVSMYLDTERNRNRNRNRNLSKVGNGIVINGYGSATLPLRDYLTITHFMVLCRSAGHKFVTRYQLL